MTYMCPKCGREVFILSGDKKFPVCDFCGCEDLYELNDHEDLEIQKQIQVETPDISDWKLIREQRYRIRQKHIFNNPEFNKALYNKMLDIEEKEIRAEEKEWARIDMVCKTGRPVVTCPTCGSTNTKKISGLSKAASVGLFGIFSQKVKHQFKCNSCGYEW